MKMTTGRQLFALVVGCLAILTTGCGKDTYKIGVVLPLTGDDSVYGQAVRDGIELAHDELLANAEEGSSFELMIEDSASDPEKAKNLIDKLYGDGALLVLGGVTSAEAKEMISVAEKYDRVLVSPSASSPELTGISRNLYRIWPSDFAAANKQGRFALQTPADW